MSRRWIEYPDLPAVVRLKRPVRQNLHDRSLLQRMTRREEGQTADTDVMKYGVEPHTSMVGGVASMHLDVNDLAGLAKFPALISGLLAEIDATMQLEIVRMPRYAVFFEIAWRRAQQVLDV